MLRFVQAFSLYTSYTTLIGAYAASKLVKNLLCHNEKYGETNFLRLAISYTILIFFRGIVRCLFDNPCLQNGGGGSGGFAVCLCVSCLYC